MRRQMGGSLTHFGTDRSARPLQYEGNPAGSHWTLRSGATSWRPNQAAAMRAPPSSVNQSFHSSALQFSNPSIPAARNPTQVSNLPRRTQSSGLPVQTPQQNELLSSRSRLSSSPRPAEGMLTGGGASTNSFASTLSMLGGGNDRSLYSSQASRAWVAQRSQLSHKELMHGLMHGPAPDRQVSSVNTMVQGPWNNRFIHGSPIADRGSRWPNASTEFEDVAYAPLASPGLSTKRKLAF